MQRGVSYTYNEENAVSQPFFLDVSLPSFRLDLVVESDRSGGAVDASSSGVASGHSSPLRTAAVFGARTPLHYSFARVSLTGMEFSSKKFPNGSSTLQLSAKKAKLVDLLPVRGTSQGKPFATVLGPSRRSQLVSDSTVNAATVTSGGGGGGGSAASTPAPGMSVAQRCSVSSCHWFEPLVVVAGLWVVAAGSSRPLDEVLEQVVVQYMALSGSYASCKIKLAGLDIFPEVRCALCI